MFNIIANVLAVTKQSIVTSRAAPLHGTQELLSNEGIYNIGRHLTVIEPSRHCCCAFPAVLLAGPTSPAVHDTCSY